MHQVNETSTSAFFEWQIPEHTNFNISCFHVEIANLKYENFTEKTSFGVADLEPYTNTTVLIRSCTDQNLTKCGDARVFAVKTDVAGESRQ